MTWAPTTERRTDRVTAVAARSLHDLLEAEGEPPVAGDSLPILWHWLAFPPQARQSEMGADGHPETGTFLPPTSGRRRMFAGGKISLSGDPRIEARLERESTVSGTVEKRGRSGDLLFVTVDSLLSSGDSSIAECNDIVYKGVEPAASAAAAERTPIEEAAWEWGRTVVIDPVVLFRFSALSYNAHRIHYDRDYATGVEGYPGLVVHGPLQAILLADLVRRSLPERVISSFSFRSNAPAFDRSPLELRCRFGAGENELELAAFTAGGVQTMSAQVVMAEHPEESK